MRIGIDLGGTKIEAIALGNSGNPLIRQRVPTPAGDYHATLSAIAGLVDRIERDVCAKGSVGPGSPGAMFSTDWWRETEMQSIFSFLNDRASAAAE